MQSNDPDSKLKIQNLKIQDPKMQSKTRSNTTRSKNKIQRSSSKAQDTKERYPKQTRYNNKIQTSTSKTQDRKTIHPTNKLCTQQDPKNRIQILRSKAQYSKQKIQKRISKNKKYPKMQSKDRDPNFKIQK